MKTFIAYQLTPTVRFFLLLSLPVQKFITRYFYGTNYQFCFEINEIFLTEQKWNFLKTNTVRRLLVVHERICHWPCTVCGQIRWQGRGLVSLWSWIWGRFFFYCLYICFTWFEIICFLVELWQFSNIQVSRRYKHFDWLQQRLAEKFSGLAVPPLPEKQIAGWDTLLCFYDLSSLFNGFLIMLPFCSIFRVWVLRYLR